MTRDGMRLSRVVALALVVGTFFVTQEIATDLAAGKPVNIANDAAVVLVFWAVWAVLTPAVLMAVRRWPLDARPAYRPLLIHVTAAALLATLHSTITLGLRSVAFYLRGDVTVEEALKRNTPAAFVWGVFTGMCFYAVVVMVYNAA